MPDPAPAPGQALVRVEAAGVNFIDVYHRTGLYKAPMPLILGREGAGTVLEVAPDVRDLAPGDRVAWAGGFGGYAEKATIAADELVKLPDGVSARQGAAAMLQGMTAHYLAISTYPLKAGDTCLVHAGAGGVGLLLTQVAKMRGARVLTTVSTAEKAKLSREAGADAVIDYTKAGLRGRGEAGDGRSRRSGRVRLGRKDHVREEPRVARAARDAGALRPVERAGRAVRSADPRPAGLALPHAAEPLRRVTSPTARSSSRGPATSSGWVRDGKLKLRIGLELPLSEAAEAHRALEGRRTTGKVLLVP